MDNKDIKKKQFTRQNYASPIAIPASTKRICVDNLEKLKRLQKEVFSK